MKFRHSAGFGKRMEYWIIGKMIKEGLDVYVPLVDDFGIDAIVRKQDGTFLEIQIKARSSSVKVRDAALFAAIEHPQLRENYYFVFYSERMDKMWIMSSKDLIEKAAQNKNGKNKGKRSVWLNGSRKNKTTGLHEEYPLPRFAEHLAKDFALFRREGALQLSPT
jgi:hypothetical protein